MPRIRRDQPILAYRGQRSVYGTDDHVDVNGNIWGIEVTGDPDLVRLFRERGQLFVQAEELDQASHERIQREVKEWLETHPKEPSDGYHGKLTLEVRVTLRKLVSVKNVPFRVIYRAAIPEYQPLAAADGDCHGHILTIIDPNDAWANVHFQAQGSDIFVSLGSSSATAMAGDVATYAGTGEHQQVTWAVIVCKQQAISYELSSNDIVVPVFG